MRTLQPLKGNARAKFSLGDYCCMTTHCCEWCGVKTKRFGFVIGFSSKDDYSVRIRTVGLQTPSYYHMDFWEHADHDYQI